ncbi:MAG: cob(I)yrinic acid a,c-diamide adenosyltransferase [bacterium]|nr:cob(I)yrinic acid a,c-diamide adenosyltransferase [bacterium]
MSEDAKRGLVHLYSGDGKGKTTAAMGLAARAAGSGKHVVIAEFLKGDRSCELNTLRLSDNVEVMKADCPVKFSFRMTDEERERTRLANDELLARLAQCDCDLIVADEAINAYRLDLIDRQALKDFVVNKPEGTELVLTGRQPDEFFIEHADYATEMVCRKHPYREQGIKARKGIEF